MTRPSPTILRAIGACAVAATALVGAGCTASPAPYAVGSVSGDTLTGDLVLQASGDLTLGGRTLPDGTIDVPIFDHYDANALPGIATLTPEDPLAGFDDVAAQVAASGIRRVAGDVVIDDRLWETAILDKVPISPITINDNLIDFTVTPGVEGAPATMDWRPRSAVYSPTISVTTGAPDSAIDLDVTDGGAGHLTVVRSPLARRPCRYDSRRRRSPRRSGSSTR